MTDFKTADGFADVLMDDDPIVITAVGSAFIAVPTGREILRIKMWGAGGGGGGRGEEPTVHGGPGSGGGFINIRNIPVTPGETLLFKIGGGGGGGVGSGSSGISGDGGAGGGQTQWVDSTSGDSLAGAGGGGGGGGANAVASGFYASGGAGGGGGGEVGGDGLAPALAVSTFGGGGGSRSAGGAGGVGTLTGESGSALTGGDGADGSGSPFGANATGGVLLGGDGGAHSDTDAPGGGGGGAGTFGGGGGGSGDTSPAESGGGGGGGPNFLTLGVLSESIQADGTTVAGSSDSDYPGGLVGQGGAGGADPVDNGVAGFKGAAVLVFSTIETVITVNDLVIENNAPVMVEGIDQIAQQVRAILLICQGEWFLDLAAGTPWFTRIIGHKFNAGQINITVRDAILSVDGVASIRDITSVRGSVARSASVKVKVLTTQGAEVIIEAEVP